jgi:hypothetical protein
VCGHHIAGVERRSLVTAPHEEGNNYCRNQSHHDDQGKKQGHELGLALEEVLHRSAL